MRYFTSDLHLGHANIVTYCGRPFADVEAMNTAILNRWRATVSPDDEVWVLGDVALGKDWQAHVRSLSALPGRKVLVPGNHDFCWKNALSGKAQVYREVFAEILQQPTRTTVGTHEVLVAHMPYLVPTRTAPDKLAKYRPVDEGLPLLCGHIHEKWQTNERQINVGVDVWDFRPVSEDALVAILSADTVLHKRRTTRENDAAVRDLFDPVPANSQR